MAEHFAGLAPRRVVRFELPNLWALNFVLYDVLAGGASQSLRIDTQGKLLGTAIGELLLAEPARLAAMVRPRQCRLISDANLPLNAKFLAMSERLCEFTSVRRPAPSFSTGPTSATRSPGPCSPS